jgi:nephrocystin-4
MGLTFEPAEAWASLAGRRAPSEGGEPVEVLVFINDEEDATEECFRIRVNADAAYVGAAR